MTARVLFVNLTKKCNVDCPRCYLTPLSRKTRDILPPGVLSKILSHPFYSQYDGPVVVIHQGGEPQLLGREAFCGIVKEVFDALPRARQTVVSNLFASPSWFQDLAHGYFQSRIETTWAATRKMTLLGDEGRYQDAFKTSLSRCITSGLSCPVNVEMNEGTIESGADVLLDMAVETGAGSFEFDLSFDFETFRENPVYGYGNTPLLPPTVSYTKVSSYLLDVRRKRALRGLQWKMSSHSLLTFEQRGEDMPFNTNCEARFLTLNPDGTMTTNPLYSDLIPAFLGNIADASTTLDDILNHPNRIKRIEQEKQRFSVCSGCAFETSCQGGPGHAPVFDGSGECAGLKSLLMKIEKLFL